jgi:predicted ATPase/DNA-binding SARP family transcriptional activator/Tfp pilus assembly protein PilF
MDKGLRLKCLGSFEVSLDGQLLSSFISSKVPALLCFLALEPGAHSRTELAGLLWAEVSEEKAKRSLRMALSDLRKLVEPYLNISRQSVAFKHELPHQVDAADFESQSIVENASIDEFQELSDKYEGDFLNGFYVDEAPLFEEWMLHKRENLRTASIRLLDRLSEYYLMHGHYDLGVEAADKLLNMEPWREETHRQLMKMFYRSGQRSAALTQYEKCKAILGDELDVLPIAATVDLYERIKAAESDVVRNLPPQATPFVGRQREMAELSALVENPECRLITLAGVGGIGKSRLSIEIAKSMGTRFLDGVYFVPLAPLNSEEMIIPAIASAIKFQSVSRVKLEDELCSYLEHKEILLVLDNFEHLTAGAIILSTLLERVPKLKILITSRVVLSISWEWVIQLAGLEILGIEARNSNDSAAVKLFSICSQKCSGIALNDEELLSARKICSLLEGIPLGIEITAGLTAQSSPSKILEEIESDLNSVESKMLDSKSEHRSLSVVFEHSWRGLSHNEKILFRSLSVFRGGFDIQAVEGVLSASLDYAELLLNLTNKSLITMTESESHKRFGLLEPVRQFAQKKLEASSDTDNLHRKHLLHFLRLAEFASSELLGPKLIEWLDRLDQDQDNFRTAFEETLERDIERGVLLCSALIDYWWSRGKMLEGSRWAGLILERIDPGNLQQHALMQIIKAEFDERLGDFEGSKSDAEQSLAYSQSQSNKSGIARSLLCLGTIAWQQGMFETAHSFGEEALEICEDIKNKRQLSSAYGLLGRTAFRQSNFEEAKKHITKSLSISRELDLLSSSCSSLSNLGIIANSQADYRLAETYYKEALDINQRLGDLYGVSICIGNIGLALMNQGKFEQSKETFERTLALKQKVGDKWGVAWAMSNLGIIAIEQGDFDRAESLLHSSLAIDREQSERSREAIDLGNLGNISFLRGDLVGARLLYDQSLEIREEIGHQKGIGKSLISSAHVELLEGNLETARAFYERSLKINREIGDAQNLSLALAGLSGSWLMRGDLHRAAQLLGFVEARVLELGSRISSVDRPMFDRHHKILQEKLDSIKDEFEKGSKLSLETAIDLALGIEETE